MVAELHSPQAGLVQDEHLPATPKAEVGSAAVNGNPAQQDSAWRPHVNTVPTAAIDVAVRVTLDAVRDACIRKREEPTVGEKRLPVILGNIKGIASDSWSVAPSDQGYSVGYGLSLT
jgi:hypothetical protein